MSRRYHGIGWRTCPRCELLGYAYKLDNHYEVKHPINVKEGGQFTFTDSSLTMKAKKQKTCYIRKGRYFRHNFKRLLQKTTELVNFELEKQQGPLTIGAINR